MKVVDTVVKYFEAWNRFDADALEQIILEGGCYRDPIVPQGLDGAGLKAYASDLWKAFPDLRFEFSEALLGPNGRVACEWIFLGTQTGPLQGQPASGRSVRFHGIDVFEVVGEKLALVWGHYDTGHFFQQLQPVSEAA